MSVEHYYNLCNQHMGRPVEIHTHEGEIHHGVIEKVDNTHVHLRTLAQNGPGLAGPGGPGMYAYGFGPAFAGGMAGGMLGSLTGIALNRIAYFRPHPYY